MAISYLVFFMSNAIPFVLLYNPLTIVTLSFYGKESNSASTRCFTSRFKLVVVLFYHKSK